MHALPAPCDTTNNETIDTLQLNELGPVVINEDGTISRISNWHEMSETERENVKRVLVKRNNQRLARLSSK
jgi:hypothetical protein